jgi:hypothetical protein
MANHIAGSGDLKFFQFILSELIIKCVIRFRRFVRILETQWKDFLKINIFNVGQQNKIVCKPNVFFPQANGIAGFGSQNLCFYLSFAN